MASAVLSSMRRGAARLARYGAGLAVMALIVAPAGCDLIETRGEAVYDACLNDVRRAHTSVACECYVDEVYEQLSFDDWNQYHAMAGRGLYADTAQLRATFNNGRMSVFERAARRCGLNLFPAAGAAPLAGSGDVIAVTARGAPPSREPAVAGAIGRGAYQAHDRGYDRPGYGRTGFERGWPSRRPDWRRPRAGGAFPAAPWPHLRREDEERPICIRGLTEREGCMTREQAARLYNDGARYWLLRGDAELATVDLQRGTDWVDEEGSGGAFGGRFDDRRYDAYAASSVRRAMEYWSLSIDWGRPFGAQSALMAQRRLQAHMVQCESSANGESLQRISRRAPGATGDVISLKLRQAALAALGYYAGEVDGHYGPVTRDAARGFQRELGYDETGSLSPRQTTLLICHAAQTARDPHLQNALGIMYATGLGVARNPDLALEWFETAARRDDADAYFNLALVYGTGAVLGSYRLCGVVENPERADAYLRDAAALGHPVAERWRRHPEFRRHHSADARWLAISNRLAEAAAEGEGAFYLEWRSDIDVDRFDTADLACLEPERGTPREPY
ncbi:MAG: tetratricopeptide repeat protein [Oceanicaulis sp.]